MMKRIALIVGGLVAASFAYADCILISTKSDQVRVRESGNLNSRVLGKLEKDVELSGYPSGPEWYEIAGGDYPGAFVHRSLLKVRVAREKPECAAKTFQIEAGGEGIRIRESASTEGKVRGTFGRKDPPFTVTLDQKGWFKIKAPKKFEHAFVSEEWSVPVKEE